jgi:probable selenium-dependent hydroxylase accessory protein YqeC
MHINNSPNENEQLINKLLNVQECIAQNKTLTISIVGAGGKTHLSFWLAKFFKQLGLSVCLTTTTKMYYPEEASIDHIVKLSDLNNKAMSDNLTKKTSNITFLYQETLPSKTINEVDKVKGLQQETLKTIIENVLFDVVIVEADGSKHHPIKAPARHEPCIAKESQIVIAVTGAEAIFSKANSDNIQRWAEFSKLTHCLQQMEIDQTILKRLLSSPQGMFKGAPEQATKIWVINKYDLCSDQVALLDLVASLLKELPILNSIWLTQLNAPDAVKNIVIKQ